MVHAFQYYPKMAKLVSLLDCLVVCAIGTLFAISYAASACSLDTSSAFFIFGDSTVDPGNNNHIETIPENRADYKPYGQSGFFEEPTGRFSNGRVLVDFIGNL